MRHPRPGKGIWLSIAFLIFIAFLTIYIYLKATADIVFQLFNLATELVLFAGGR